MMISSGSVGTFCSQTTLPVLSTTHTAVVFTETSRPTKCDISIAPSSHPEVEVAPVWILYVEGLRSRYSATQPPRYTIFLVLEWSIEWRGWRKQPKLSTACVRLPSMG